MAIKTKSKELTKLPKALDDMLQKGFTEQFMKSKFEKLFETTKNEQVIPYLQSNDDGFVMEPEGIICDYGKVSLTPNKPKVDVEKLVAFIKSSGTSLEQILMCCSQWNHENLQKTITLEKYNTLISVGDKESLTFRANSEFKDSCEAQFSGETIPPLVETKLVVAKPESKPEAKAPSAAEKARAAKAKVSSKKTADDDLDAILNKK